MYSKRTTGPVEVRVWAHIDQRGPDECWPWAASVDHAGYGQINDGKGRIRKAHQIVLELKLGRALARGENGLHHCDNPPCCNPAHLYAGTHLDNSRDMHERGRYRFQGAPGVRNTNAKLTDDDIRSILATLATDCRRGVQARLARQHGVSESVIMRIKQGKIWRHVTAPDPL